MALFIGSAVLSYADSASATPGSPSAQDSKNQQNNPAGPKDQDTGTNPNKDSKKDATNPANSPTSTTISGAPSATKTPQKDAQENPRTNNRLLAAKGRLLSGLAFCA